MPNEASATEVRTNDGVAFAARGDLGLIVYKAPARLHRSRWLYDLADELAARNSGGILIFMVVLPTADPPDAATRAENNIRMKRLAPSLRRFVTVAIGDEFRITVVRAVMRAISILQRKSGIQVVSDTLERGLGRLLEERSDSTPSRADIERDLIALYRALDVEPPKFDGS